MDINTEVDWWVCLRKNLERFDETFFHIYHDSKKYQELVKAARDNNHDAAHNLLEAAWSDAPDSRSIHGWPGWGDLCDLCSEYWVCDPEEPNVLPAQAET